MRDTPRRERLARAACFHGLKCEASGPKPCESTDQCFLWDGDALKTVDAILTKLQEPSEDMVMRVWQRHMSPADLQRAFSRMIQHIRDGGS